MRRGLQWRVACRGEEGRGAQGREGIVIVVVVVMIRIKMINSMIRREVQDERVMV